MDAETPVLNDCGRIVLSERDEVSSSTDVLGALPRMARRSPRSTDGRPRSSEGRLGVIDVVECADGAGEADGPPWVRLSGVLGRGASNPKEKSGWPVGCDVIEGPLRGAAHPSG